MGRAETYNQGLMARTSARHPKLSRALERLAEVDLAPPCTAAAPPQLVAAIEQFNAGQFFEQHETLELLWRATPDPIRHLYEGILQVGVGMHHALVNKNFHGAAVKLDHGLRLLAAFPPTCQGVDVARLIADATAARQHLLDLGPQGVQQFDVARVPRVHLANGA